MKKILVILIMFIGTINISAQENNEAILQKIDSLQSQLNELQINYEFHKLESELQRFNLDLKTFCNDVACGSNAILISCYHGYADKELYESYKNRYDACVYLLDSYKENFNVTKEYLNLKINKIKFSFLQSKLIDQSINALNAAFNAAEHSLNHYKTVMSMYKDLIQ